ncbi:hypothetical protein NEAUS03_1412 [Nematocida ausubeli]|nr:hypothetical protein NEAUS03_1412 [Nematocida ausubeli]
MYFVRLVIACAMLLLGTKASKPLTFNLPSSDSASRERMSALITTQIKSLFENRKEIPYISSGYAGVKFYYNQPKHTTIMQYGDAQIHYNVYVRNNSSKTYSHTFSIINRSSDTSVAAEVIIKLFQNKMSFSAKQKGEMTNISYDLINKLEQAIIDLSKTTAELDEYQYKRLVQYVK